MLGVGMLGGTGHAKRRCRTRSSSGILRGAAVSAHDDALKKPVWELVPTLQIIQFPWRFTTRVVSYRGFAGMDRRPSKHHLLAHNWLWSNSLCHHHRLVVFYCHRCLAVFYRESDRGDPLLRDVPEQVGVTNESARFKPELVPARNLRLPKAADRRGGELEATANGVVDNGYQHEQAVGASCTLSRLERAVSNLGRANTDPDGP